MAHGFAGTLEALAETDPRLDPDRVAHVTGDDWHDVLLVGVVHDHPASMYRVRTLVGALEPDTLALELPSISVPLFEGYADDERTPPAFGGEMSTAIQAAGDAEVVGIDAPSVDFVRALVRKFREEKATPRTMGRVLDGLASVTRHAVTCRVAATLAARAGVRLEVDTPVAHDCDVTDEPDVQATNERRQVSTTFSLLRSVEPSRPVWFRDTAREECMASRIAELRENGSVVAVVGLDHLESIESRLA